MNISDLLNLYGCCLAFQSSMTGAAFSEAIRAAYSDEHPVNKEAAELAASCKGTFYRDHDAYVYAYNP